MLERGQGRTEWLVANAASKIDTTKPGRLYRDGTSEGFEIYRDMLNEKTLKPESALYVFRDEDGHLVGVNDLGSWSVNYVAWTKIDLDMEIRYHIAKPLGNDFVTINRAVKKFVRSLIKQQAERDIRGGSNFYDKVATMSDTLVLKISNNSRVELDGQKMASTAEVAQALGKIVRDRPDPVVSIEADKSAHYEAIGMAIYGSTRAGFSGERLRVAVGGKPLLNGEDNEAS